MCQHIVLMTTCFWHSVSSTDNLNPLSTNPTKWSNTLKQFVGKLPKNYLSVFDHFVGLALKGLKRRLRYTFCTVQFAKIFKNIFTQNFFGRRFLNMLVRKIKPACFQKNFVNMQEVNSRKTPQNSFSNSSFLLLERFPSKTAWTYFFFLSLDGFTY